MGDPFAGIYRGRRVLVTGHTGFKGSWLCQWLHRLGAHVAGIALPPPAGPNLFAVLGLAQRIDHHLVDVRDAEEIQRTVAHIEPEIIFHLAAQAMVRQAYREPKATFDTNVGGTVNVLEAIRSNPSVRACVVVTTDKCYENREWPWGYRECDPLGGHDPYSASKAAAELAVASWRKSFCADQGPWLATARAGNVIGGGDWSPERIATDVIAACAAGGAVHLRNPAATRPWQHVLEPISAYLHLGARLLGDRPADSAGAWNVGPDDADVVTVEVLARQMVAAWGSGSVEVDPRAANLHEAGQLKLDGSKIRARLGWHGTWNVREAVVHTVAWHRAHLAGEDCRRITDEQTDAYLDSARRRGLGWAGQSITLR